MCVFIYLYLYAYLSVFVRLYMFSMFDSVSETFSERQGAFNAPVSAMCSQCLTLSRRQVPGDRLVLMSLFAPSV